jgi:chitinase
MRFLNSLRLPKVTTRWLLAGGAALLALSAALFLVPSASAAVGVPIRVNSNGPAYTDSAGNGWTADAAYTSGGAGYDTLYGSSSTSHGIAGTSDPALYQTYDLFNNWTGYKFDVANGTYASKVRPC